MKSFGEKITLNVGGVRYETYTGTLQTFPGTKLCRLTEPQACTLFDYDPNTKEFFFDRSAKLFEEVLSYYRTKHLHCPKDICSSVFEEELCFWEISDVPLSFCCWQNLSYSERQQEEHSIWEDSKDGDEQGLLMQMERSSNSRLARWRPKIWNLFENPCSCLSAKVTKKDIKSKRLHVVENGSGGHSNPALLQVRAGPCFCASPNWSKFHWCHLSWHEDLMCKRNYLSNFCLSGNH